MTCASPKCKSTSTKNSMEHFTILYIFLLVLQAWESSSVTTRIDHPPVRNFRRHTGPPPFADWELGLRESIHQALLREHYSDPTLRDQLLDAPLIGRRNTASPFGDIAVLGRGQLYVTSEGFKFVQDSDQDCIDCQDERCARSPQCELWKSLGHHHKLLALWTVKRIRHRDPRYGHVFEIEYTISPITSAVTEELVRRHGYFNYNIPGHIFVIRSDPRLNSAYDDKWYKNQQTEPNRDFRDGGHFKPGILIGVTPDGYKHVLHSFPGFYSSYHPQNQDQTTIDPKEYELYKKLIESLAAKTSNVPHRFSPTEKNTVSTTPTYLTTFVPVPQTTYVHFMDGQLVPVENTVQPTTKFPTTSQPTQRTSFSEPDLFYRTLKTTTMPPKHIIQPVTTIHYYAPVELPSKASTATASKKVIAATSKKPTTIEEIDTFDIFAEPLEKTATPKKTTLPATTQPEHFDLFPVNTSTEPMQPVTESSKETSPDSISEQLPAPDEDVDTTVPYVSSTVTQPSTTTSEMTKPIEITTLTQKLTAAYVPSTASTQRRTSVLVPSTSTKSKYTSTQKHTSAFVPSTTTSTPTQRTSVFIPSTITKSTSTQKLTAAYVPSTTATTSASTQKRTSVLVPSTTTSTERTSASMSSTTTKSTSTQKLTAAHVPSTATTFASTQQRTLVLVPATTTSIQLMPSTIAKSASTQKLTAAYVPSTTSASTQKRTSVLVPFTTTSTERTSAFTSSTTTKSTSTKKLTAAHVPSTATTFASTQKRTSILVPSTTASIQRTSVFMPSSTSTQKLTSIFVPSTSIESTFAFTQKRTSPFMPATATSRSTQKLTSVYVPSTPEEVTTVIEKIPYKEERTTIILPIPLTQEEGTTPIGPTSTMEEQKGTIFGNIYTVTALVPTAAAKTSTSAEHSGTLTETVPSTIFDVRRTQPFTISTGSIPPRSVPTTRRTTMFTKPTTLFQYSFDSTTKDYSETVESTINTLPATTITQFPSTEPIKVAIPTTTSHYYYTFETGVPKTSAITTESVTEPETLTTNLVKESTLGAETTFSTQETTKKHISPTIDDFLLDAENLKPRKTTETKKYFNEDDIFGKAPPKLSTEPPETTTKPALQSDIDKALFGGRSSKQIKISSKITRKPVINTRRIIYANFYAPSTVRSSEVTTTEFRPSTDQSYSTSISFEVNKRNTTRPTDAIHLEPTVKADLSEVGHNESYKVDKEKLEMNSVGTTTERSKQETKKVFDNVALQLVNHAISIDYLQKKPSRQPKYRRRSFSTRKQPTRSRKNNKKNKQE